MGNSSIPEPGGWWMRQRCGVNRDRACVGCCQHARARRLGTSKTAAITRPGLTWTEIGRFAEALTFARRALSTPVEEINADYTLGPRGIWVIGLNASGRIRSQSDLARHFGIPKNLVTEQIALLVSQDLVATAQAQDDKRQKTLSLPPRSRALNDRLGAAFEAKLDQLLGRYSAADVRFCTA